MRQPRLDLMAGERARQIAAHPEVPPRIPDPTDPRCGQPLRTRERGGIAQRILDPTNRNWGELPE